MASRPYGRLLCVAAALGAAGTLVDFVLPFDSADDLLRILIVMTPVRACALAAFLYLNRRHRMGIPFRFSGASAGTWLLHCGVMLGLWAVLLSAALGEGWGWPHKLAGVLAALVVGAFEEYAFRGILLDELASRRGPLRGSLYCTVLFTVFHARPQAVLSWPHIFLTGTVFANLRLAGMGLGQLALIHAAIDAMFFFVGKHALPGFGPQYWVFLAGLYAYSVWTWTLASKKRAVPQGPED